MTTRIDRLRQQFDDYYIDALLVTNEKNIFYLTGFPLMEGDGALLVTKKEAVMVTDDRYATALQDFDNDQVVGVITRDYYGAVNKLCKGMNVAVMGFENTVSFEIYDILNDLMDADIVPCANMVEKMRAVKDHDEIVALRRAAQLQSAGYQHVLDIVHPGMSEREVAIELDYWMKKNGAEKPSFDTIVASGENSAKPHATVSDRLLQPGDMVTLDFGYYVDGYTADMTRTFAIGEPAPLMKKVYDLVNQAREKVIAAAQPGITGEELDHPGRSLINDAGYEKEFQHGMGHGIGLGIHELPLSYGPGRDDVVIQPNQVITVEPGIYIPDVGGVRIEDDILVTANGAQRLTTANTDLVIVDAK